MPARAMRRAKEWWYGARGEEGVAEAEEHRHLRRRRRGREREGRRERSSSIARVGEDSELAITAGFQCLFGTATLFLFRSEKLKVYPIGWISLFAFAARSR